MAAAASSSWWRGEGARWRSAAAAASSSWWRSEGARSRSAAASRSRRVARRALSPAKPSIPGVQLHAERAPRVVSQLPSSCPTFSSMPDTPFPLPDEEVWMLDILSHAREFDGSSKGDAAVAEVGDGRGEHGGGVEGSLMVAVVAGDGT
ncbi:hypothetical protein Droror1_Dr00008386 [Drosera rotundifolia]